MLFVGPRMRVCFAFRDACGAQGLSPESGLGLGASVLHSGTPAVLKVNVLRRVCYASGSRLIGALWGRHSQVGSLPCAAHLLNDGAGVLRRALWEHMYHVNQNEKCQLDFDFPCSCKL